MGIVRLLSAIVGLALLAAGTAWSQAYPSQPVRVIIVFPPGGSNDIVGRIVFQKVSEQLGQQFVIDNRGGAAGTIGSEVVAKLSAQTLDPMHMTPEEFARRLKSDYDKYEKVVRLSGARID